MSPGNSNYALVNYRCKIPTGKIFKPIRDALGQGLGQLASGYPQEGATDGLCPLAPCSEAHPHGAGKGFFSGSPVLVLVRSTVTMTMGSQPGEGRVAPCRPHRNFKPTLANPSTLF